MNEHVAEPFRSILNGFAAKHTATSETVAPDPRDPDNSREGIFRDHNCWKCGHGAKPCPKGHTLNCEYPHARND